MKRETGYESIKIYRRTNIEAGVIHEINSPSETKTLSLRDILKGNTNLESHDYGDIGWKRKQ